MRVRPSPSANNFRTDFLSIIIKPKNGAVLRRFHAKNRTARRLEKPTFFLCGVLSPKEPNCLPVSSELPNLSSSMT